MSFGLCFKRTETERNKTSLYNPSQVLDCLKVQFVGKGKTEKEKKIYMSIKGTKWQLDACSEAINGFHFPPITNLKQITRPGLKRQS